MKISSDFYKEKDKDGFLILPVEFQTSDGFCFKQIKRTNDIAIFEKTKYNRSVVGWEVIVIQKVKEFQIGENKIPAKESFCPDNMWGTLGWTYINLKEALKKFENLLDSKT